MIQFEKKCSGSYEGITKSGDRVRIEKMRGGDWVLNVNEIGQERYFRTNADTYREAESVVQSITNENVGVAGKQKIITLTNSYHNTSVALIVPDGVLDNNWDAWLWVREQVDNNYYYNRQAMHRLARIKKALCPSSEDCACGIVR